MSTKTTLAPLAMLVVAGAASLAFLTGCGSDPVAPTGAKAAPVAAEPITRALPAPQGRSILTLTGVGKGNSGPTTSKLDFATVDGLAHQRLVVLEPFLKKQVTFTGVRMDTFMKAAGFPAGTARLSMRAVDDYHVALGTADMGTNAFLATRADGKRIALAKGGPVRLIFTGKGKLAGNSDNWIWSVDRIKAG
jgi:hypothetical protein